MIIFQVALTDIPDNRAADMATVKVFAEKIGVEYRVLGMPENKKHWQVDGLSNWIRAEFAAQNCPVMYADWDIEILPEFELPIENRFDQLDPEAFFVLYDNEIMKKMFADLQEYYGRVETGHMERSRLNKITQNYRDEMDFFEKDAGYVHKHHYLNGKR